MVARIGVTMVVALALVSSTQTYALRRADGGGITLMKALAFGLGNWIIWGLALPLILRLGRTFDGRRGRRALSCIVHVCVMLVLQVPATLVAILTGIWLFSPGQSIPWSEVPRMVLTGSRLQIGLLLYVAILGLGRGIEAWEQLRQRELEASRLEAQAVRAHLEALAARLQPHFMFNALHTVGALIDEDPFRARQVLTGIGDLLRGVLAEPRALEIALKDELGLLGRFLEIERIRFADRLSIEFRVTSEAEDVFVPRFLVQPIVENALKHGIAPLARGGSIVITARIVGKVLVIVIANDGVPLDGPIVDGVGLATTRERLLTRYREHADVCIAGRGGWVETMITLPVNKAIA